MMAMTRSSARLFGRQLLRHLGHPPASKVYRAARVLLSQPGVDGYFGSGSGVASQEQFHSARGLVKAFLEEPLAVPAVVRLGGNGEEKAIEILQGFTKGSACRSSATARTRRSTLRGALRRTGRGARSRTGARAQPHAAAARAALHVPLADRRDHLRPRGVRALHVQGVRGGVRAADPESLGRRVAGARRDRRGGGARACTECLACEVDCRALGAGGGHVALAVPGLDDYRAGAAE